MKQQLLLLEDVEDLGKVGDLVTVKSGFARNFLLPKRMGVVADKNTLKRQEKLQEERKKRALIDRKQSEEIAEKLKNIILKTEVKVDPEGKMYGSVSTGDIATLLKEEGFEIEKKQIKLPKPIKDTGVHNILILLKEDVEAEVSLSIKPEGVIEAEVDEVVVKPVSSSEAAEASTEDLEPIKSEDEWTHKEKQEVNEASKKA